MLVLDKNLGWNAGARSVQECTGDCQARFTVPDTVVGVICGLSKYNNSADYREIGHALRFMQAGGLSLFYVIEYGGVQTAGATYVSADIFTIRRVGTVVQYLKNEVLVYTSGIPSTGTLFMDSSLYAAGDEII